MSGGGYIPDPTDPSQPTISQLAGNMAYELQSLKGYIQSLIKSGSNFFNLGSWRNKLRNGDFSIAQRGSSVTVNAGTGVYTLDGWMVTSIGADIVVSQVANTVSSGTYGIKLAPEVNATAVGMVQRVESNYCQGLVTGKTLTVSGYFWQSDITIGMPSIALSTASAVDNWTTATICATLNSSSFLPPVANTWQWFSAVFTLTADATNGIELIFNFTSGIPTLSAGFALVQLEEGVLFTPFEFRPPSVEVAFCERYYQQRQYHGYVSPTGVMQHGYTLPVFMRATPTLTYADVAGHTSTFTVFNGTTLSSQVFSSGAILVTTQTIDVDGAWVTSGTPSWMRFNYKLSAEL